MSNVINARHHFMRRQDQRTATQRCNVYLERIEEEGKHEHMLDLLMVDALKHFLASEDGQTLMDTNYAYGNDPKSFTEECSRHGFMFNFLFDETFDQEKEWKGLFLTASERYVAPEEFARMFDVDVIRRCAERATRLTEQHRDLLQRPLPKVADLFNYISQQIQHARYSLNKIEFLNVREPLETVLHFEYVGRNVKGEATVMTIEFFVGRMIDAYAHIEISQSH